MYVIFMKKKFGFHVLMYILFIIKKRKIVSLPLKVTYFFFSKITLSNILFFFFFQKITLSNILLFFPPKKITLSNILFFSQKITLNNILFFFFLQKITLSNIFFFSKYYPNQTQFELIDDKFLYDTVD